MSKPARTNEEQLAYMRDAPVREKILRAAVKRFTHYGYHKTTINEIASDCKMSAGNIYRFFPNKLALAERLVRFGAKRAVKRLRPVLDCAKRNEEQRLVDCVFMELHNTYDVLENAPHLLEMAQMVQRTSPHITDKSIAEERAIYAQILQWGRDKGEFQFVGTADEIAEHLQLALVRFRFSQLITDASKEELERGLKGVLRMLLNGLKTPQAKEIAPSADIKIVAAR